MINDSTDKMPTIIFESLIEQISEGSCYDMKNMQVQGYLDERILKTTLISEISSNKDIERREIKCCAVLTTNYDDAYISTNDQDCCQSCDSRSVNTCSYLHVLNM